MDPFVQVSDAMIGPVLFTLGGVPVSPLGTMIMLGAASAAWWISVNFGRLGIDRTYALTFFSWLMLAGAVGAKLWGAVEAWAAGESDFASVLLSRSGAGVYGGLVVGLAASLGRCKYEGIAIREVTTAIAAPFALAHAIARIGCFLVGDDYGTPTTLPWGISFPKGIPPTMVPVHPAQLYDSAWMLACALFLTRRFDRSPFLFAEYLVLMGSGRFLLEFIRIDPKLFGTLSAAQVIALVCVVAGLIMLKLFGEKPTDASQQDNSDDSAACRRQGTDVAR
jgi:phosphatidylglycerol:prolipoprotein diacylglycerol transferase